MKTKLTALVIGALSLGLMATDATAQFINGNIGFAGSAALDSQTLNTATRVNDWNVVDGTAPGFLDVSVATGSFATVALGTNADMIEPYVFNPSTAYLTPTPLWTVGGFTFDLQGSTITFQSSTGLVVEGSGIIRGAGFQDTPGRWSFAISNAAGNPQVRFAVQTDTSAIAVGVPEGGSAVALLGLALAGMGLIRHKIRSK